jgi:hypothetical protein
MENFKIVGGDEESIDVEYTITFDDGKCTERQTVQAFFPEGFSSSEKNHATTTTKRMNDGGQYVDDDDDEEFY